MSVRFRALLLQFRVLFPLIAFAMVGIGSDGTWGWTAQFAWAALPIYLIAPAIPLRKVRSKLLPDRPPLHVQDRWHSICQQYGVQAELHLIEYGSANGLSAGGRRGGVAAVTPQVLEWDEPSQDLLLRHLALQLEMGISRHTARATLLWLYTAAYVMILGWYAWATDDDISLLGLILSQIFGLYFLFRSGGYGHEAKHRVDERLQEEVGGAPIRALIERVIQDSPTFMEVDIPAFTGPLWFALPHDAKEKGEKPEWDSLTRDRFKVLRQD